ncbi:NACHT domain-containing protein [Streptomyces sp. LZ34]
MSGAAAVVVVVAVGLGQVDPAGVVIGGGFGLAGLLLGVQARRWQDSDAAGLADRLAADVTRTETAAWRGLLGGSDRTIDVPFVHRPAPAHEASGAAGAGTLREVAVYYRRLRPGRMVVTGAPGAGKTVLAVHLMLLLLQDRAPGDAVPVRLPLAGFDPGRHRPEHTLEEWIAAHLTATYQLRRRAATALVAARKILPVLDGLDEMDADPEPGFASRAARALEAVNAYQQGTTKGGIVLTCRTTAYSALEALRVWAQDAARIELQSLDAAIAWDFLTSRVTDTVRWEGVLDALVANPAGPLARGLSTPWRLTLAATVYEQRDPDTGTHPRHPDELLDSALNTPEKVRDHLLGLFIPSAARTAAGSRAHDPACVRAWLTTLARYLDHNATTGRTLGGQALPSTDILLDRLWPLADYRWIRVAVTALTVPVTLAVTIVGLVWNPPFPPLLIPLIAPAVLALRAWVGPQIKRSSPMTAPHRLALGIARDVADSFMWSFVFFAFLALLGGFLAGLNAQSELLHGLAIGFLFAPLGIYFSILAEARFRVRLVVGIVTGCAFGLYAWLGSFFELEGLLANGLGSGLRIGVEIGLQVGFIAGVAFGAMALFVSGEAGLWYVALLLSTRQGSGRWLPWRLARFLDWCCNAGLMRPAGIAYQFRHRELQDFLARTIP